jgi:membrane fusion protein, macrolide-specific efflux system
VKTGTKVVIGIVSAVAVIGAGAGIALSLAPQTEGTFLTEEIQVRDVDVTVAASGTVDPSQELGLQFPGAAAATLETLLVSVGDTVTAGQILASINPVALEAAVVAAQSSIAAAQSSVANAETSADSARQAISTADQAITAAELAIENVVDQYPSSAYPMENDHLALLSAQKQKVAAEAALETARRQLEAYYPLKAAAEASLLSARAGLVSATFNLENASMTAPVAATVIAIASGLGEPVGSTTVGTNGTTGFIVLAALDTFVVKADFAESEVVGITTGQSVKLEFDAIPGEIRDGSVTEVALFGTVDVSGASLTTYEVTISVPNAPVGLRAGMTVQASITTEEQKGVVAAPVTALIEQGDGYIVQVEGADGTISSVEVEVGIRGGYYVEIISGLSAGDRVVTGSNGVLPDTGAGGFGGPPEGVERDRG